MTQQISQLLNEKIVYLEKFFSINEFEILNFESGNFDNVEPFYKTRDALLELIREIDLQIDFIQKRVANPELAFSNEQKGRVSNLLARKDEVVERILEQDLKVLELIEKEKTKIIKDLQSVGLAKKAVGAYKIQNLQIDEKV